MKDGFDIICIGAVLWDVIGRSEREMRVGSDVPGRITMIPGGVAMNVAMTLREMGLTPALLSAIGDDPQGAQLVAKATEMGMVTEYIHVSKDQPTDRYMAIEGPGGLVAAVADAHSLEAAGNTILIPITQGPLAKDDVPYEGIIALDGNLTEEVLAEIATSPAFAKADLRVAPASPGKAERLAPLLARPNATLYVNCEEAGLLCGTTFDSAPEAALALSKRGAARVLVTDGSAVACELHQGDLMTQIPPEVCVKRITGAGDTFMAAHLAAEYQGADRALALTAAIGAAAAYVSGEAVA
ncbi:PfkB family carbohydrate kinase [Cognatishimia sp. MH4019]|uniref:PfkB family carbohydrate kinase n=1 Tax=Cognatishimia sp. MH4019 TaxID=2854030 RepID=UPI001CD1BB9B|nr:PfkB family carbohydrate kinase [Cognatishimia sp. MH4019]